MNYLYTVLGTTATIIVFEIIFNYGLGDKVKDLFLSTESRVKAAEQRLFAAKAKL